MSTSSTADLPPARSDAEAKDRFFQFLNQTIHTVSPPQAHWMAAPTVVPASGDKVWSAFTVPNEALRLRVATGPDLYLRSTIQYSYADREGPPGGRKVSTLYYRHDIAADEELQTERYSWQWHPLGWPHPHVHIHPEGDQAKGFGKLHVPTGRVFLEAIVIFLIHDLKVKPATDRWEEILGANLQRVSRFATWGGLGTEPPRGA